MNRPYLADSWGLPRKVVERWMRINNKIIMKAKEVYFFTNGTTMVFDNKGEQILECQGCILDVDTIKSINEHCNKDTVFYFGDWKDKTKSAINLRWWFGKYIKGGLNDKNRL